MKRLIIPFVAAFGLSLGAATGVTIMRAPKAPPHVPAAHNATKNSDSSVVTKDSAMAQAQDSASASDSTHLAVGTTADVKTANPSSAAAQTSASDGRAEQRAAKSGQPGSAPSTPSKADAKLAAAPTAQRKPAAPPTPISDSLIGRRLAQVFAAMQPKDAARVLEQMNDNDVRAILGSLSSKQQAAILGSFPTQRAALIVQATLRTGGSGGME